MTFALICRRTVHKGAYLNDVRTEGGGRGVGQNVTVVLIGCVNGTVTRGEGVQKSENFADVI